MITVLHPEIYRKVIGFPGGIAAFPDPNGGAPLLVVKATKEFILAAKVFAQFKIYLVPVEVAGFATKALVSAFFDDEEAPLIITTPLLEGDQGRELSKALGCQTLNVHFFDEHGREYLVYEAELSVPPATKEAVDQIELINADPMQIIHLLDDAAIWFSYRNAQHDEDAITVKLLVSKFGDSLAFTDARHPLHSHHGAKGFSLSVLEREEPGTFQEEDIIKCLGLSFDQSMIYHSPKRVTDGEEICDVMVVTQNRLLIIQAKDNPNIERIARQKLTRKRTAAKKAFDSAIGQIRGAHTYIKSCGDQLRFRINDDDHTIDMGRMELWALAIVKEIFDDETRDRAKSLNALMTERRISCAAFEYRRLYDICYRVRSSDKFYGFLAEVVDDIKNYNDLPAIKFYGGILPGSEPSQ